MGDGGDAAFEWMAFDPADLETARTTHTGAVSTAETARGARDAAARQASAAHATAEDARVQEAAARAAEAGAAGAPTAGGVAATLPATAAETDEAEATGAELLEGEGTGGRGTASSSPAGPPPADAAPAAAPATTSEAGPSGAALAAQQTAEAEAQAAQADQALGEAEATLVESTEAQGVAAEQLAATEARAAEADEAAQAAQAAQSDEEAAAADVPVVGEDVTLAQTLAENPQALALMGLEQYADRPEIGEAAAAAIRSGDWKALQEAGLSEDEAKAVFDTVEAVRIGVENSSHVVSFEAGTVVDDQVGRDEVVIPGVSSWDELDQTRQGDDLILATAEGSVRVVGYFDRSRGNVARIRLADAASDDHDDSTLYRAEQIKAQEQAGVDEAALASGAAVAVHLPRREPTGPITAAQKALAETRNRAMYDWGSGQVRDVQTLMFGASNRDNAQLKRGHNKVLGRYGTHEHTRDPRESQEDFWEEPGAQDRFANAMDRDGAAMISRGDRAQQDLAYFSSLDAEGQKRHIEHIAKKGEKKQGFLGKVLGVITAVVSFINPIVGAILQGVAVVAQGGSILDGIKAGLGSLMAGGTLGGGALTRVAGTALATDGDPTSIGLAMAGVALEKSPLGDVLSEQDITVDGGGIDVGIGDSPITFGVDSSLDFGAGVAFDGGSVDLREGGLVTLTLQQGDYRGSITSEGAFTLQQNLSEYSQDGSTTWGGFSLDDDGNVSLVADQSRRGSDHFTTFTSGIIDLRTGEASTTVGNDASFGDLVDELRGGTPPWFVPILPDIRTGDPTIPDNVESTVDTSLDLSGPQPDMTPPEPDPVLAEIADKAAEIAPPGEMEEVVVTGIYTGPELGITTAPGRSEDTGADTTRAPGDGGLSSQDDLDAAKQKLAGAALALSAMAGSGLAEALGYAVGVNAALDAVQAAIDDPTPGNVLAAQAAVNGVFADLAEIVKHPKSAMAKRISAFSGSAAAMHTLLDPDAPTGDRFAAALTIGSILGGPAVKAAVTTYELSSDVGSALYTFGNSAGAIDPDTGKTPFEETADEALRIEHAARAQGAAYDAAIRAAGPATAAAIEAATGLDVGDEVEAMFNGIGAETRDFFDDVGHAVAVTHVVSSALGDALEGSIRAAVAGLGGG